MSRHRRWSTASVILLVCSWIAATWLNGTAAQVARSVLVVAVIVTGVLAFFLWFSATQGDDPPPVDPDTRPSPEHRRVLLLLGIAPLALCLIGSLAGSAADGATWGKVVFTLVAVAIGAVLVTGSLYRDRMLRELADRDRERS